jgi:hypothetical protein
MDNLSQVYNGTATGPLLQSTVQIMVSPPISPGTGLLPANDSANHWFGIGLDVYPNGNPGASWEKYGSLSGTSAFVQRYVNGTVFAATFNARLNQNPDGYAARLQQIVSDALYEHPVARDETVTATAGSPLAINVLARDTDPNRDGEIMPDSIALRRHPRAGTISAGTAPGVVTYTPPARFRGTVRFRYTVADDFYLRSNPAVVTIDVRRPRA